ncbi:hypothetical protein ACJ9E6_004106 [Providencia rettgeri]
MEISIPTIITFIIVFTFCIALVILIIDEEYGTAGVLAVVNIVVIGFHHSVYSHNDENVSKGEYYATQCQLIETNIDNGLFQSNTNKLKCGDVIENVTVDEYQQAIQAYQGNGD